MSFVVKMEGLEESACTITFRFMYFQNKPVKVSIFRLMLSEQKREFLVLFFEKARNSQLN